MPMIEGQMVDSAYIDHLLESPVFSVVITCNFKEKLTHFVARLVAENKIVFESDPCLDTMQAIDDLNDKVSKLQSLQINMTYDLSTKHIFGQ